jgi:phenylacetate-coenzyme A ligase PaaK-like adenylate-forming protein
MTPARLSVPDVRRLGAVQELCEIRDPYLASPACDALFVRAMRESVEWHRERSPFYARVLEMRGFDPASLGEVSDCLRIPFVPAEFFKQHEVLSVPRSDVTVTATSSGTTGQKSQMFFDAWSVGSARRMVEFVFESLGWIETSLKVNYLLYTYEVEPDSKLGTAMTDNFLCGFAPAREVFCALRRTGSGGFDFDSFGCIEKFRAYAVSCAPTRIFGFPAFLYFTLERMKKLGLAPLRLAPGSLVFLGGGWKGHADQAVQPSALYALVTEMLGIPAERIRDGFGSVEHCVPYVECREHRFHVPAWSRVAIRDVASLEPLGFGERGFLHFVSPYMTSVPAQSVMMGDLASMYPGSDCACGIETPFFVVHGRAGTSKNKSCAVAASELLKAGS